MIMNEGNEILDYEKEYPNEWRSDARVLLEKALEALQQAPAVSYSWGRFKTLNSWALANEIELFLKP